MGSFQHPAAISVQSWRDAEASASAAEEALLNQAASYLRGEEDAPTAAQRSTTDLLRAVADQLLHEAMQKVEDAAAAELTAVQLAALKAEKP